MAKAYLYFIRVLGGKEFYVGSTVSIKRRMYTHLTTVKHGKHSNKNLQRLYNKGRRFYLETIECQTREEAFDLEQNVIDLNRDNPDMLNIGHSVKGGDNLTRNPDRADIIRRMTNAIIKRYGSMTEEERRLIRDVAGEKNPMYGKTHTPETRAKISEKNKGHTRNRGCKLSKEHRRKISERAKLRVGPKNTFYGKTHSAETRRLISEKNKGNPCPTRKRIEVDGVVYETCQAAAASLGVSPALITYRLKSNKIKYAGYKTIERESGND